ncbi:MAG: nitric-oxide reductase large subunit, partial [Geminicoccaceae bacterium]|nr:nitric-oxide reductase large subunit [Geminicoccaceae bacterium]
MRYETQKLAYPYFAGAIFLFAAQVLVGVLAGLIYVMPNLFSEILPFNIIRMIHTNALIVWLLLGFFGA